MHYPPWYAGMDGVVLSVLLSGSLFQKSNMCLCQVVEGNKFQEGTDFHLGKQTLEMTPPQWHIKPPNNGYEGAYHVL